MSKEMSILHWWHRRDGIWVQATPVLSSSHPEGTRGRQELLVKGNSPLFQ